MKLGLSHSHRMEQRLIQSPQMIQAMQILQLSGLDLQERVEQELLENPFLERVEGQVEGADRNATPATEEEAVKVEAEPSLRDSIADDFERMRASEDGPGSRRIDQEASDRKHEAMSNAPDRPRSLASALIEQIALADLDPRQREIAEFLIFSLDHRGYLPDSLEELAQSLQVHHRATRPTPEFVEDLGLELPASAPEARSAASAAGAADGSAVPPIEPVGVRELEHVLHLVRRATHPALGAVDLQDCLLLQLESHGIDSPLVLQLVEHHLDDLVKNRLPRIAKANGQSLEEIKAAIAVLKELDPIPARDYGEAVASVIVPDVVLEELDGVLEVRLGRRRAPGLQVNPDYRELLEGLDDAARHAASSGQAAAAASPVEPQAQPVATDVEVLAPTAEGPAALEAAGLGAPESADAEDAPVPTRSEDYARLRENEDPKKWARRRLESARWFLDAVEQRGNTMLRIARAIFTHQYAFLEKGPKGLVPLRMQEVADETGVHISTVSRAVAGKHVQTPRGIFPLKYFFTSGTTDESGAAQSQVSIQQRIAELVEAEDSESPLSDDQLAAELQKRFGIKIARRTVTKYRKALSIPSSSQRKHF